MPLFTSLAHTVCVCSVVPCITSYCDPVCFLRQDTFFYSLVYDPTAKTLLADKGEIRVGPKYQAEVGDMLKPGTINFIIAFYIMC